MPGDLYRTGNTARGRVGSMEMARLGPTSASKREQARSAVNDVQRPFFDVERGFSYGFA
jgi:hypothetical protein